MIVRNALQAATESTCPSSAWTRRWGTPSEQEQGMGGVEGHMGGRRYDGEAWEGEG